MSLVPECRRLVGHGRRLAAMVSALALAVSVSTGWGQDVTEPSLKAAFIYNFAKFTEWPLDILPASVNFVACVLGDGRVGTALDKATKGRVLSGRTISVSQVTADGPLRSCHLLYVSGITASQVGVILTAVKDAPVLTISDLDDFAVIGGIVHVFVENGKMRFDLNYALAKRSRLQLSSKLLLLASQVRDDPNAGGR